MRCLCAIFAQLIHYSIETVFLMSVKVMLSEVFCVQGSRS